MAKSTARAPRASDLGPSFEEEAAEVEIPTGPTGPESCCTGGVTGPLGEPGPVGDAYDAMVASFERPAESPILAAQLPTHDGRATELFPAELVDRVKAKLEERGGQKVWAYRVEEVPGEGNRKCLRLTTHPAPQVHRFFYDEPAVAVGEGTGDIDPDEDAT